MSLARRQALAINQIIQEEVERAMKARHQRDQHLKRVAAYDGGEAKPRRMVTRDLIKEAIQGRQPGSPLFTPPPEKRKIREGREGNFPVTEAVTEAFRHELGMHLQFDKSDPSMAAAGPSSWALQIDHATDDFMSEVDDLVNKIIDKLVGGEYYYPDERD